MDNLPPVVEICGHKCFEVMTTWGLRYPSARTIGGRRYYAKDYPVTSVQGEFDFIEPNDNEWLEMMK